MWQFNFINSYQPHIMPRVTKKDKELGKAPRSKPKAGTKPYESRNPKTTGGRDGAKKTGFRVGPAHAPRDAYLGKGSYIFLVIRESS